MRRRTTLSPTAWLVLCVIHDAECRDIERITAASIAREIGRTERTVRRAVAELRAEGMVDVVLRGCMTTHRTRTEMSGFVPLPQAQQEVGRSGVRVVDWQLLERHAGGRLDLKELQDIGAVELGRANGSIPRVQPAGALDATWSEQCMSSLGLRDEHWMDILRIALRAKGRVSFRADWDLLRDLLRHAVPPEEATDDTLDKWIRRCEGYGWLKIVVPARRGRYARPKVLRLNVNGGAKLHRVAEWSAPQNLVQLE